MDFKKEDLIIEMWCSKPQSPWTPSNPIGIKITHMPTKLSVCYEGHRSQHKNRAEALKLLSDKIELNERETPIADNTDLNFCGQGINKLDLLEKVGKLKTLFERMQKTIKELEKQLS